MYGNANKYTPTLSRIYTGTHTHTHTYIYIYIYIYKMFVGGPKKE